MYLFNPDNDLALAHFNAHYTPPASAVKMAADLAMLPLWYAPDGSKIVAEGPLNNYFSEFIKKRFAINVSTISFSEISKFPEEIIVPWGWNPALRRKLREVGISQERLPSDEALIRLRKYSGRQYAVKMLYELKRESEIFCGESYFFSTLEELFQLLDSQPGNYVLKIPNSGSGKGLIWVLDRITDKQTDWCRRVVRTQGGIVAEPVLTKTIDFAMEFFIENGRARFVGYSLFRSAASGAYHGNELMSDEAIENILSKYVPGILLRQLRQLLIKKLIRFFPDYRGCAGVDMMICETEKGYRIQPCVEINMRMNMGMVAHIFHNRVVNRGSTGRFVVDFFKKQGSALAFHRQMEKDRPLLIEKGKIRRGYLPLTPTSEQTSYAAWVVIE